MIFRLLSRGIIILSLGVGCAPQSDQSSKVKKGKSTSEEAAPSGGGSLCSYKSQARLCPPGGSCASCKTAEDNSVYEVVIEGEYYAQEVLQDIPQLKLLADDFDIQHLENIGEVTVLRKNYEKLLRMDLSSVGAIKIQQ